MQPTPPPGFVPSAGAAASGAGTGAPLNGAPLTPPAGVTTDQFTSAIQQKLLDMSGMTSSNNTDLENSLTAAQQGVQTAGDKSDQATTLDFNNQISEAQDKGQNDLTNGLASGQGGIINMAALRELTDLTDKNVNDLESKKQEALLNNDAATAKSISDLQMQALTLKQTAIKDQFSQLLQLGQFGVQAQTEARAQSAAADEHTKAVGDLITANPQAGILSTDTLDQAYKKIGANPDNPDLQLKKAQIAQIYNNIKNGGTGTGTEAERTDALVSQYSSKFVPGATINGTPVMDVNGYITPAAFKAAISEVPASMKDAFIQSVASKLSPYDAGSKTKGDVSSEYGLTAKQIKDNITG